MKCFFRKVKNSQREFWLYYIINPLTSPGEGVTVFTSPYLSVGAPALGEAKGLMIKYYIIIIIYY